MEEQLGRARLYVLANRDARISAMVPIWPRTGAFACHKFQGRGSRSRSHLVALWGCASGVVVPALPEQSAAPASQKSLASTADGMLICSAMRRWRPTDMWQGNLPKPGRHDAA